MSGQLKWAPLHPLPGVIYAEMVKATLEKNSIPCIMQKDFFTGAHLVYPTNTGAGLETVLLVPEDCLEEAARILEGMVDSI